MPLSARGAEIPGRDLPRTFRDGDCTVDYIAAAWGEVPGPPGLGARGQVWLAAAQQKGQANGRIGHWMGWSRRGLT